MSKKSRHAGNRHGRSRTRGSGPRARGASVGPDQKKKSRSWAFRSALPCLRKRTSSASSAQNSLQKNWPSAARHGCISPFTIGRGFPQNAQQAAKSFLEKPSLIPCPYPRSRTPSSSSRFVIPDQFTADRSQIDTHLIEIASVVRKVST